MIRKYRQDFVEDPNGTYYRTVNSQGQNVYTEVSPAERYDLSKRYTLHVTAKYTNTKDGIIPTKAFLGYILPVLVLLGISILGIGYFIYKKKKDEELEEIVEE